MKTQFLDYSESRSTFQNVVCNSGYKIKDDQIIPIDIHAGFSLKDVNFEEVLVNIYLYSNLRSDIFSFDEVIINIVNRYGLLTSTNKLLGIFITEAYDFQAAAIDMSMKISLEEQKDDHFDFEEKKDYWRYLISLILDEKQKKRQGRFATWTEPENFKSLMLSMCSPFLKNNQIGLRPNCLGSALILYFYKNNSPKVKGCNFCGDLFVDISATKNQIFCKKSCQMKKFRENKIKLTKKELKKLDEFRNWDFSVLKFIDIEKKRIRAKCNSCGKVSFFGNKGGSKKDESLDFFSPNQKCPKCKKF